MKVPYHNCKRSLVLDDLFLWPLLHFKVTATWCSWNWKLYFSVISYPNEFKHCMGIEYIGLIGRIVLSLTFYVYSKDNSWRVSWLDSRFISWLEEYRNVSIASDTVQANSFKRCMLMSSTTLYTSIPRLQYRRTCTTVSGFFLVSSTPIEFKLWMIVKFMDKITLKLQIVT